MIENKTRKIHVFYLINIFIALILGLLIYIVFRPDTYISKWFSESTHLGSIAIGMRVKKNIVIAFLRNYMGDFLWAYALTYSVQIFIEANRKKGYIALIISCIIFEILIEVMQKLNIISGTFDLYDIIVEVFATCSATLFIYMVKETSYEKSNF